MKLLLAPDSFKGSLSAGAACDAMQRGARRVLPDAEFVFVPLADGGEGTLEALAQSAGGEMPGTINSARVQNPLGKTIEARWAILADGRAVIEMAQASGLTLIPENERDAMRASSFGTGQLIKAALDFGCRELLIGIGGSATTDGGAGALSALGARFLGANGKELPPGGAALNDLHAMDLTDFDARLWSTPDRSTPGGDIRVTVLCDVTNPLCGPNGAARIYGPQKGASPNDVKILDDGLEKFAHISASILSRDWSTQPGAGASGGLGFGLLAFCYAHLRSGIEVVLEAARFEEKLQTADLVLTGEGALDAQTLAGKTIAGVCRAAREKNVPVIAFGGKVSLTGEELDSLGLLSAFAIADAPLSLHECIARAEKLLESSVERALRLWVSRPNPH